MINRMTHRSYADELDSAAERIGDLSRADLQIIIRRAALRLRNTSQVSLDPEHEEVLQAISAEINIGRNDLIRRIIQDWLIANAYVPHRTLDDDSGTEGTA